MKKENFRPLDVRGRDAGGGELSIHFTFTKFRDDQSITE